MVMRPFRALLGIWIRRRKEGEGPPAGFHLLQDAGFWAPRSGWPNGSEATNGSRRPVVGEQSILPHRISNVGLCRPPYYDCPGHTKAFHGSREVNLSSSAPCAQDTHRSPGLASTPGVDRLHTGAIPLPDRSGRRGSNSRPSAWEADALPTELRPQPAWMLATHRRAVRPGDACSRAGGSTSRRRTSRGRSGRRTSPRSPCP